MRYLDAPYLFSSDLQISFRWARRRWASIVSGHNLSLCYPRRNHWWNVPAKKFCYLHKLVTDTFEQTPSAGRWVDPPKQIVRGFCGKLERSGGMRAGGAAPQQLRPHAETIRGCGRLSRRVSNDESLSESRAADYVTRTRFPATTYRCETQNAPRGGTFQGAWATAVTNARSGPIDRATGVPACRAGWPRRARLPGRRQ